MKKTLLTIALFTAILQTQLISSNKKPKTPKNFVRKTLKHGINSHLNNLKKGNQDILNKQFEKNLEDARSIQNRSNRSTYTTEPKREPVVGSPDWAKRKNL